MKSVTDEKIILRKASRVRNTVSRPIIVSKNVQAQHEMTDDLNNGAFAPDFLSGLTAPADTPNPFWNALSDDPAPK